MKVLILAFVLAAFCALSSDTGRCFSRKEKRKLRDMMQEKKCVEPMEQLVLLPVPRGYSEVMPSRSLVKRCIGQSCWGKNKVCMPTTTEKKTIKVEAWRSDKSMTCMEVEVDEHVICGCLCRITEEDCSVNQVFDSEMCHCDKCREGAMAECMNREGNACMLDVNGCTCICADPNRCRSFVEPKEQPVQLLVPKGYSHIEPSRIIVKTCSGHLLSWSENYRCTPTKIEKKTIKVEAWTSGEESTTSMEVEVEEQ